jgi:hypothetical protein
MNPASADTGKMPVALQLQAREVDGDIADYQIAMEQNQRLRGLLELLEGDAQGWVDVHGSWSLQCLAELGLPAINAVRDLLLNSDDSSHRVNAAWLLAPSGIPEAYTALAEAMNERFDDEFLETIFERAVLCPAAFQNHQFVAKARELAKRWAHSEVRDFLRRVDGN